MARPDRTAAGQTALPIAGYTCRSCGKGQMQVEISVHTGAIICPECQTPVATLRASGPRTNTPQADISDTAARVTRTQEF